MQQMQQVAADRVIVGLDLDALAGVAVVMPVAEQRAERGDQPVGDVACIGGAVTGLLRQRAAERRDAGAHHVHRVGRGRNLLENVAHRVRQATQTLQLLLVGGELRARRQRLMDQQVRDLLELGVFGRLEDVVAAVVQVIAGAPDGAERGVAGGHAGQCHRFLGFGRPVRQSQRHVDGVGHGRFLLVRHFENSASSFFS